MEPLLIARGYDVLTARSAGQLGKSDIAQLEFAVNQRRALLTHNLVDFLVLATDYFRQGKSHHGILVFRRMPVREAATRIAELLDRFDEEQMRDRLLQT